MKIKVTKEAVSITEYNPINAGEVGLNVCEFQLPEVFSSLTVTAAFNNIPVPVCDGKCVVPTLKKGTVVLGVYAYKENSDGVELMYSPKPTAFYVNEGSYIEEIGIEEIPTISEYEKYCKMFMDYLIANKTESITDASTHDQYPSAKAVYDLVESEKGDEISVLGEVLFDEEHTNQQVYGALAMDEALISLGEALEGKQDKSQSKVFEKIATVTVTPDEDGSLPVRISITKDENGNSFELTDIYCDVLMGLTDGSAGRFYIQAVGKTLMGNAYLGFTNTALRKWHFRYDSFGEGNGGLVSAPSISLAATADYPSPNNSSLFGQIVPVGTTLNISNLEFIGQIGDTKTFMEGTTITLWGVRK